MLNNMTIKTKMIATACAVSVLTLLVGATVFFAVDRIVTHLTDIADHKLPGVQNLLLMQEAQQNVTAHERTAVMVQGPSGRRPGTPRSNTRGNPYERTQETGTCSGAAMKDCVC